MSALAEGAAALGADVSTSTGAWGGAAAVFVGVAAITMAAVRLAPRWAAFVAARTTSQLDDLAVDVLGRTRPTFALAIGALVAQALFPLPHGVEDVVRRVAVALCLIQCGLWGAALVRHAIERYVERIDPLVGSAAGVLRALGLGAVWSLVALLFLANLGVDVTAGIAGLGVGGVAVALAVQNILGDLFASLSIVLDRPFTVGDFVVVGEFCGTVEHIGIKTTRLRSLSGEVVVFSNSDLLQSRIRNYKDLRERRVLFSVGVAYATPRDTLRQIPSLIREAVESVPATRFDRAQLCRFGDSSLDFEVVWFFTDPDFNRYMEAQEAIFFGVLDRFAARGVEIPFPQRTVWLHPRPTP